MLRRPQEGAEVQAAASLFDNAEVNRLIDENYERVQKDGWAELRIPQSIHHISRADFEPNALDAADKLCAAGYEVYIVGGSIRDIILGKSANDFDISRRDLTINALYYDIKTDEIVDWHGGLRDLRNGILDTLTDSDLTIRNVPPNAIRALRFKARYGFRFSERLEKAMRDHAAEYLSLLSPASVGSQTPRMFRGWFAVSSFEVLTNYNVMASLFPPAQRSTD